MPNPLPRNPKTPSTTHHRFPSPRYEKPNPLHTYGLKTLLRSTLILLILPPPVAPQDKPPSGAPSEYHRSCCNYLGTIRASHRSIGSLVAQFCGRPPATPTARAPDLQVPPPGRAGEAPDDPPGSKTERSVLRPANCGSCPLTLSVCFELVKMNVGLVSKVMAQQNAILWPKSILQQMGQQASIPLLVGLKDHHRIVPHRHAYLTARNLSHQNSHERRIVYQPQSFSSVIHDTWNRITPPQDTPPPAVTDFEKCSIIVVLFNRAEVTEFIVDLIIVVTLANQLKIVRMETQDNLIAAQTIHFLDSSRVVGFVKIWIHWNFQSSSLLLLFRRPLGFFKPTTIALLRKSRVDIRNYFQVRGLFVHSSVSTYQLGYFVATWAYCFAAASLMLGDLEVIYKVIISATDFSTNAINLVDIFTSKSFDSLPQQAGFKAHLFCCLSSFSLRNLHEDPMTIQICALIFRGRKFEKSIWIMHVVILYLYLGYLLVPM